MNNNLIKIVAIGVVGLFITSCTQSDSELPQVAVEKANKPIVSMKQEIKMEVKQEWQQATVHFKNLEGGFYGFITKSGTKLLPLNLDKAYRMHGAVVKFKGEVKKGMRTIQQWGTPFQISQIELIKAGQSEKNDL